MNEFFFELNIWFESDYDVEGLKDKFKIEPTEVVKYNDCDDEDKKTAQFFCDLSEGVAYVQISIF